MTRSRAASREQAPPESLQRRAMLTVGATFAVYAGTVAAHRGEFWPFSIFPMFSQAGRPWTRALMLDVSDAGETGWGPWAMAELPAAPIPTRRVGASTNDLSKFVQLTRAWTPERVDALRAMWQPALSEGRELLLLRATGRADNAEGVEILLHGLVRLGPDSAIVNPNLETA